MAEKKKIDLSDLGAVPVPEQKIDLSDLGATPVGSESEAETPDQVSGGEAAVRGAASGLTLGFSPRLVAGAEALGDIPKTGITPQFLEAYNKHLAAQQAREKLAAEQHPIIYHGASIVAPIAVPVAGALGAAGKLGALSGVGEAVGAANLPGAVAEAGSSLVPEALAEASPLAARLAKGVAGGAAIAGTYAAGKSENPLLSQETGQDVLSSAAMGGALGGTLSGLGAGAQALAEKGAEGEGMFSDIAKTYLKGIGQQDISDFNKVSKQAYDYGQLTGNKWFQEGVNDIKASFNALQEAGEASEKKANITDIFNKLNELKQRATEVADPDAQKTINQLINMFENKAYGLEQAVVKGYGKVTETPIPGQAAVPSTAQQLEQQAAELNANAQQTARGLGRAPEKYEVYTDPESGGMNIRKIVPSTADQAPEASFVNKEFIQPSEGTPEVPARTERGLEIEPIETMERPKQFDAEGNLNTPQLGMNQAVEAEKEIGGMASEAFAGGQYRQGKMLGDIDEMISAKVEEISPDYAQPREQWKNLLAALDKAGINKDQMLDLKINQATEANLDSLKPEIMKKINDQILKSSETTQEGLTAKDNLDRFFTYLQKAGMKDVPEIRQNLENNMQDYALSQTMRPGAFNPGVASHNPKVTALSLLKSYGARVAHTAGLVQTAPLTQNLINVAPGAFSGFKGSAPPRSTPMENFSRNLSYSNPEQLKNVSQSLKSDPNLSYLGTALDRAIEDDNQIQKNAIIFAISQNPSARALLSEAPEK